MRQELKRHQFAPYHDTPCHDTPYHDMPYHDMPAGERSAGAGASSRSTHACETPHHACMRATNGDDVACAATKEQPRREQCASSRACVWGRMSVRPYSLRRGPTSLIPSRIYVDEKWRLGVVLIPFRRSPVLRVCMRMCRDARAAEPREAAHDQPSVRLGMNVRSPGRQLGEFCHGVVRFLMCEFRQS